MDRAGGIGISDDHVALRDTVRRWTGQHCPPSVARSLLDAEDEPRPTFWDDLAGLGWAGIHLPEAHGGDGFALGELVVVLEELGRACAPGPFLPTVIASAVIDAFGGDELRDELLPGLARGERIGAVGFGCEPLPARVDGSGLVVDGQWDAVLSGALADVLVLPVEDDTWVVVDAGDVSVEPLPSIDPTRRVARVRATGLAVPAPRLMRGAAGIDGLVALLIAAEAVGVAAWCVETAADYAKVREQFGRPIGQFQAVKHRCADMLCALEQARSAVWDACRDGEGGELAIAVAAAQGTDAAYECAKSCIQVLGGIGFTWEHDAHLYLKRSMASRQLVRPADHWHRHVAALARAGVRRVVEVELPAEAEPHQSEVRAFIDELRSHDKIEWNRRIADAGYIVPHWPRPWGRDASPLEQLVIDDELRRARIRRPHLAVGAWALPTIIVHGTEEQQQRWVPATLRGEITWCQMFSEPGAGSDLASLSTKATRTDSGWLLTGQKVWTSMAHIADWGICLARTDASAPRHEGIGCFLVDMRTDGIDIRPLRELTGAEMFNEVFLSDVFVPDECVIGGATEGWHAARTTLGNERVSMGGGASMGPGVEALLELAASTGSEDEVVIAAIGAEVAAEVSLAAMGTRMTLRALSGAAPGPEASIRKLLGVEHDQRVQEVGLQLLGARGATGDGVAALWLGGFLGNRSLSIAGGTSEIQRNVIAERLLGLPRDP